MALTPAAQKFILHWGEMGSRWGINRTVAQIHALLYLSPRPLQAEEISATLSVARSTVSTGLRDLQSWGIISTVHVLGDRRDHFVAMDDVWKMFRLILDERKRRELDPTIFILRESIAELEAGEQEEAFTQEKLNKMLDFFETMISLYDQIEDLPLETINRLARMGNVARRVADLSP